KELQDSLTELYANAVYDADTKQEGQRQSLFVIAMRLSGFETEVEVHTNVGRADVVLKNGEKIIVVEIKYSKHNKAEKELEEAIGQIREKKYYVKYLSNNPILLGIVFSENKDIACMLERS
ncbi:MAG: PD-(D/E)XK nuclease domain-containing protein, partial [Endomicrobium sp.]|uniref:PD-(D/E)XK nuclease domain-containing protein n=1 Tax=Candidatus Endomicrobiellum cubanum TaxID=3242325 RepID=UPI002822E3EE|nr:PD-(D/E)XK nuclease domain-containing protein [Endomicrobium sp.]